MSAVAKRGAALCLVLLLSLAGLPGRAAEPDWSHARYARILMFDYRFQPSRLVLRRGTPYRLHLVNRGKELHEFTAPQFFKMAALGNAEALNEAKSELAVPPGEARDLLVVPLAAGRYEFACADHDWAGMVGKIAVR